MNQLKATAFTLLSILCSFNLLFGQEIPLPEHPRPDFQRELWENLNGNWAFSFDENNVGIEEGWYKGDKDFDQTISVPFPWGAKLSGVEDNADIGWYQRSINVEKTWEGKRVFITVGASDWETSVWLDGQFLGKHQGGYVPFSFELTDFIKFGQAQQLVIRADDTRRLFTLYGKQGYGNARGIWQTVYLEARGQTFLKHLHFSPNIDSGSVMMTAYLAEPAEKELSFKLDITTDNQPITKEYSIPAKARKFVQEIKMENPHLWSLEDPFLYAVTADLEEDRVQTYFGMRKISVVDLPGTDYPYIALNNEPIYLQLALDQSYHPDGFYTFPSDQFLQEEIMRSKSIGLNGIRTHIKVEVPRKLYWADKLGLLVMEDLPNSWGEPDELMQAESEYTMRSMIKRDYNHPSIFSWVVFNESWGLRTKVGAHENGNPKYEYLPQTQNWVASMYYLAKSLDPTRLVEDNSICCGGGHTETDINSWHAYLPGWQWEEHLKNITENTFEGSGFDFEDGFRQGNQPNINSECGNVWGYDGSTGDVDWSWDYHRMINTFRMFPKVAGWLYTEHHDVINEWNGYWRFDRTEKETGFGAIVEGMTLKDLHASVYISTGNEICIAAKGGSFVPIPLRLSVMTGADLGKEITVAYELTNSNCIGETEQWITGSFKTEYTPWSQQDLEPLSLMMPTHSGVATLKIWVKDQNDRIVARNFMHFVVESDQSIKNTLVWEVPANGFSDQSWSKKQWDVLGGKKVNGTGKGYFEYKIPVERVDIPETFQEAFFMAEVSAKQLFVKDQEAFDQNQDYMKGSKVAPSSNPNSYPMTDEILFPSEIEVLINGKFTLAQVLTDDPADSRGVLSWYAQLKDRKLREAGSYGYLVKVPLSKDVIEAMRTSGALRVMLQTKGEGGIAVYGKEFGRYMMNPSIVIKK